MRHRNRLNHLGLPADQRKAMLRSLATSLFMHDQITITLPRAKVLKRLADRIVTLAKRGPEDLHAIRQVAKLIYREKTGYEIEDKNGRNIEETVLRRIFRTVGPRYSDRNGGYTRIIQAPPRRGDASPMAVIQLVD